MLNIDRQMDLNVDSIFFSQDPQYTEDTSLKFYCMLCFEFRNEFPHYFKNIDLYANPICFNDIQMRHVSYCTATDFTNNIYF